MSNVGFSKIIDYIRNRNEYMKSETDRIKIPKLYFSTPDSGSTLVQLGCLGEWDDSFTWMRTVIRFYFICLWILLNSSTKYYLYSFTSAKLNKKIGMKENNNTIIIKVIPVLVF